MIIYDDISPLPSYPPCPLTPPPSTLSCASPLATLSCAPFPLPLLLPLALTLPPPLFAAALALCGSFGLYPLANLCICVYIFIFM